MLLYSFKSQVLVFYYCNNDMLLLTMMYIMLFHYILVSPHVISTLLRNDFIYVITLNANVISSPLHSESVPLKNEDATFFMAATAVSFTKHDVPTLRSSL